jgi:hypothetical protein
VDCGPGFPLDQVVQWAKGGGGPEPEEDDEMAGSAQITNPRNDNLEVWEINKKGELWSRTWRAAEDSWDEPTKRGTDHYGVPSATYDSDGNIRIVVLATNKCIMWTLLKEGTSGWHSAVV